MRYVLGLDGGGTKCDAVLMDESGEVLGWGRGGSTHGLYVGPEAVEASVRDAVLGATGRGAPPIAGICGAGVHPKMSEWLDQPLSLEQFVPGGEVSVGFATAMTTHGVLVLSGTGSFVHGLTPDGRSLHLGGDGPIIGDEGSAHHIGTLGIRAAFRARYSARRATSLREAVPRALGVRNMHEVFNLLYIERVGRSTIASVARTVDEEAEQGDAVARGVILCAANELGELVREVIEELDMRESTASLVATGSVAQNSRLFWARLCEIAHEVAPGLQPVQPRLKPVMGACLLALQALGVAWEPALVDRILAGQERHLAAGLTQ